MSERESWIDSFRKALHNHEEPYQLGAWERFEVHRSTRYRHRLWRRALTIAAVLLLGLGLYWFGAPAPDSGNIVASRENGASMTRGLEPRTEMQVRPDDVVGNQDLDVADRPNDSTWAQSERMLSGGSHAGSFGARQEDGPVAPDTPELERSSDSSLLSIYDSRDEISESIWIDSPITGRVLGMRSTARIADGWRGDTWVSSAGADPLQASRESISVIHADHRDELSSDLSATVRAADLRPGRRDREFAWGVAYAPMMNLHGGSAKMAMGAGVHARVQLGDGWGLGSALVLSKSQFQSEADPGDVNLFQTSYMSDGAPTILNSRVQADLVSLEVPLNLRYELSESVALSGGLSTIAYLQETYHYRIDYRQSYLSAMSTEQGIQFETGERERTERVSESEAPMSGLYWGAFYNVGAEFSWLLSNRHWVSVEPFVKIPSGGVASQELTYSSGGVQLKLYF